MAEPKAGALSVLIVFGCAHGFMDLSALLRKRLATLALRVDDK
jgi:hypothetical protein